MANIKSSIKRIKTTEAKTLRNKMVKSSLKTTIKKFDAAIIEKNVEEATATYKDVVKALDMAVSKGVIHKNMSSRKKSRLASRLNALSA